MWEAEKLFEDAINLIIVDSMLTNRMIEIDSLNIRLDKRKVQYESLLSISTDVNAEFHKVIANLRKDVVSYRVELRSQKKRTLWANFKFYSALLALAVMTWIAIDK